MPIFWWHLSIFVHLISKGRSERVKLVTPRFLTKGWSLNSDLFQPMSEREKERERERGRGRERGGCLEENKNGHESGQRRREQNDGKS
jgi:hypothetical protein